MMWIWTILCMTILSCCALQENVVLDEDLLKLSGFKMEDISEYEIVTPIRTNAVGTVIKRRQRSTDSKQPEKVYYSVSGFGQKFNMELTKNNHILDPEFKFTSRNYDNIILEKNIPNLHDCVYHGKVTSHDNSRAALVSCDGLQGLITTKDGDYFIRPAPESVRSKRDIHSFENHPHIMFKRKPQTFEKRRLPLSQLPIDVDELYKQYSQPDGPKKLFVDEDDQPLYGEPFGKDYNGPKNAMASDKLRVELAIFTDKEFMDAIKTQYPTNPEEEFLKYCLANVNAIELMYNDESFIGKTFQYIVIKVEYFTGENVFFKGDNGNLFLHLFCKWQFKQNPGDDNNPEHWDHAFFFSGKDITGGLQVIGIAPLAGMCSIKKSCTLTEGRNFVGVYTGAHELGHNFGIPHDGDKNLCDAKKFLMSPKNNAGQTKWSPCSKNYAIKYLSLPWTVCLLDDRPIIKKYDHSGDLPGQRYPLEAQCKKLLGPDAIPDPSKQSESFCQILYCVADDKFHSMHPALEGSYCAPGKWCRGGQCVSWGNNGPKPVNGGWGEWGPFGPCISGCLQEGSGISVSVRACNNPWPNNGGKYCDGSPSRARSCSDKEICSSKQTMKEVAHYHCFRPPPSEDFYSFVTGKGSQDFSDESGGCKVMCELRGKKPVNWGPVWPDGTDCTNNNARGMRFCYKGKCSEPLKSKRDIDINPL